MIAIKLPTVIVPAIAKCPPTPYANAVAIDATEISAMKKKVFNIAMLMPMSATLRALLRKFRASLSGSP